MDVPDDFLHVLRQVPPRRPRLQLDRKKILEVPCVPSICEQGGRTSSILLNPSDMKYREAFSPAISLPEDAG